MTEVAAHTTGARWIAIADRPILEEARLLAGRLEAEGIETRISPDWQSEIYGKNTSALLGTRIEVFVPEDRAEEARRMIQELERS